MLNQYITQILISASDINDPEDDYLTVYLYGHELNLELIHQENGQNIYYTYCYIKNHICYISMYCKGENIYLNKHDKGYNHIHNKVSPIFYPFDFEYTHSTHYNSQTFGKFACTVFVEKPYYKFWLIKLLPVDIDIKNIG